MSDTIDNPHLQPFDHNDQLGASVINDKYLSILGDLDLQVTVEVGQATMTVQELQQLKLNQVIELDKSVQDAVTLTLNGKAIATGELVVSGDKYAILIKQLLLEQ